MRILEEVVIFGIFLLSMMPIRCTPEDCVDGLDNDGDGYWDCDDPDCWEEAECDL